MLTPLRQLRDAWRGLRGFKAIPRASREIVFYSEGPGYWTYFEPVFQALQDENNQSVLYVTSSQHDPVYLNPPPGLQAFYVGKDSIRTLFFATLDVDVLVMTMPDLQTFHIKRSPHPVHYAYLHHSMVSTHMVYRPAAFDHFDSVLCVGPHHLDEIRHREAALELKPKRLFEHGYGRLDTLLKQGSSGPLKSDGKNRGRVLVAPTWGNNSTLNLYGVQVIYPLLSAGLEVILRPHPQTRRLNPEVLDDIATRFADEPMFSMDEDGDAHEALTKSDVMISDWSGAAMEFALGLERPVIYIDVPRKVLNPEYHDVGKEPLEATLRDEVGVVVAATELDQLGDITIDMIQNAALWQDRICIARNQWVFNVGASGSAGAKFLAGLLS